MVGMIGLAASFVVWHGPVHNYASYAEALRAYENTIRIVVPSVTALILSCQLISGAFFLSILGIRHTRHSDQFSMDHDRADQSESSQSGRPTSTSNLALPSELADA